MTDAEILAHYASVKGNSPRAVSGRVGKTIRKANAWKVQAGLLTPAQLRRWVRSAEALCRVNPAEFLFWRDCWRQ